MAEIYQFEDLQLKKEIQDLYKPFYMDYEKSDKEYVEKFLAKVVIPKVVTKMKEQGIERESVEFYDLLFSELCTQLIEISSFTKEVSDEFKDGLRESLADRRERDKDRLLYDYDFDYRPQVSEYEFDVLRMMDDIVDFINERIGHTVSKRWYNYFRKRS